MNWRNGGRLLRRVREDADDDDDDDDGDDGDGDDDDGEDGNDRDDERGDDEGVLWSSPVNLDYCFHGASSGRRVAARDSRAGEEDWTKRKKQNNTSKAEAKQQKSERRPRAERVKAGLRGRK